MSIIYGGINFQELANILKNQLRNQIFEWKHPVVGYSGFKYSILFFKPGYTPHYAEHVIDPVDGREKLVLAIPHTLYAGHILIYDIENDVIEWDVNLGQLVPWNVSNPHIAHMIVDDDNSNLWTGSWSGIIGPGKINAEPGDIIAPAPNNTWVVIDRKTKRIKWTLKPSYSASSYWVDDIIPSVNNDGVIVSDYNNGLFKLDFNGSIKWAISQSHTAAVSRIVAGGSLGGSYIASINTGSGAVWEVDDSGNIVWGTNKPVNGVGYVPLPTPWSAFRKGYPETTVTTIIGLEGGGGGIIAVDDQRLVRWGIVNIAQQVERGYRASSYGLNEIWAVFPTLRGTIGFIDVGGPRGSIVGEVLEVPYHQQIAFYYVYNNDPGDNWICYNPRFAFGEWRYGKMLLSNGGPGGVNYTIYYSYPNYVSSGSINAGGKVEVDISSYLMYYLTVCAVRATTGTAASLSVWVMLWR